MASVVCPTYLAVYGLLPRYQIHVPYAAALAAGSACCLVRDDAAVVAAALQIYFWSGALAPCPEGCLPFIATSRADFAIYAVAARRRSCTLPRIQ